MREVAEAEGVKLGQVAQPLRAALTGRATSPGIFDVLVLLGREESLARIARCDDWEGIRRWRTRPRSRSAATATITTCCRARSGPTSIDIRKLYGQTGVFTYDPGFTSTASLPVADHLYRRRRGHPAPPRLSDRPARREFDLHGGLLPAAERRAAERRTSWTSFTHTITPPHHAARAAGDLLSRLPARRPSDGDHVRRGRRALRLLPRFDRHHRSASSG